jgi:SAM-dependent methyltransferase
MEDALPGVTWTRTSYDGLPEVFQVEGKKKEVACVALDLSQPLPFSDDTFDVVLIAEVIEHIDRHPQVLLGEANRVLRGGGYVVVTTPNVTSYKKLLMLAEGRWDYDSPTFQEGSWGHRYEYSFWQMRECLNKAGFDPVVTLARDVYLDDPAGVRHAAFFSAILSGLALSGRPSAAARLLRRRGAGLFFAARKAGLPSGERVTI